MSGFVWCQMKRGAIGINVRAAFPQESLLLGVEEAGSTEPGVPWALHMGHSSIRKVCWSLGRPQALAVLGLGKSWLT